MFADDRSTLGGVSYSKLYYTKRTGHWSWEGIDGQEVDVWREWYKTTNGYRLPFVVVDPLNTLPRYVQAPGAFPLQQTFSNLYAGRLSITEVI